MASGGSATSSAFNVSILFNINQFVSVKLDRHNFILRRSQMTVALRDAKLSGYVTGSFSCPPRFASDSDKEKHIISSTGLSDPWLALGFFSLKEYWHKLREPPPSRNVGILCLVFLPLSQVLESCNFGSYEILHIRKGTMSMTEYLMKARNLADVLVAADQPLSEIDLILLILGGLDLDYRHLPLQSLGSVMAANIAVKDINKGQRLVPSQPRSDKNKTKPTPSDN
uniref:Uncharacterized protein n=1 Tax=Nelumbo nucifera TaxID=4432 RepID=A0A822ZK00_NELNU|nr:TPA_asm: hypothetical protein HUJ06_003692 [Nelumbo nucifera]